MEKKLMLGNEAVARGAYEAGVRVISSYPGTPSTEITEFASEYAEIYTEWAPNEKVAVETALGASIAGARAMACMKHVGVNVAADPLFTAAYTGVNAGFVIVAADDPAMHSSQNEQDSRYYALSAHIPMLEPADSREAKEFIKKAYDISESFDTPVFVRLTTRIAHSQSITETEERKDLPLKPYERNTAKYVMMPAMARARHIVVEERERKLESEVSAGGLAALNTIEYRNKDIGVVCAGAVYQYIKEGTDASVLKLGVVYPVATETVREFAKNVKELIVCEELEPFIENALKAAGIKCRGKDIFGRQGELSVQTVRSRLYGEAAVTNPNTSVPSRPPVMCAGCPHRSVFYILKKMGIAVSGDIGCYTLGALPPLNSLDLCVCMGASIGMAHGFDKAGSPVSQKMVAVIGDSTFIHSGITGIVNAVYNKGNSTTIILDNGTTGMTGHQENPSTGCTLKGERTSVLNLEALVRAIGVPNIEVADAYDLSGIEQAVKRQINTEGVSVIIVRRICVLLKKSEAKPCRVNEKCKYCKMCLRIGCPAIENKGNRVEINGEMCNTCGICKSLCAFGAIEVAND